MPHVGPASSPHVPVQAEKLDEPAHLQQSTSAQAFPGASVHQQISSQQAIDNMIGSFHNEHGSGQMQDVGSEGQPMQLHQPLGSSYSGPGSALGGRLSSARRKMQTLGAQMRDLSDHAQSAMSGSQTTFSSASDALSMASTIAGHVAGLTGSGRAASAQRTLSEASGTLDVASALLGGVGNLIGNGRALRQQFRPSQSAPPLPPRPQSAPPLPPRPQSAPPLPPRPQNAPPLSPRPQNLSTLLQGLPRLRTTFPSSQPSEKKPVSGATPLSIGNMENARKMFESGYSPKQIGEALGISEKALASMIATQSSQPWKNQVLSRIRSGEPKATVQHEMGLSDVEMRSALGTIPQRRPVPLRAQSSPPSYPLRPSTTEQQQRRNSLNDLPQQKPLAGDTQLASSPAPSPGSEAGDKLMFADTSAVAGDMAARGFTSQEISLQTNISLDLAREQVRTQIPLAKQEDVMDRFLNGKQMSPQIERETNLTSDQVLSILSSSRSFEGV